MNEFVKSEIRKKKIKQWQLAEAIGVSERTLIVWLRTELSDERIQRITEALNILTKGVSENE